MTTEQSRSVFLSYARPDLDVAEALAQRLEAKGHTVWWDFRLVAGTNYRAEIADRIDKADKVLVIWSPNSINSSFVVDEASRALAAAKLVPISIRGTMPPLGFGQVHTLFISDPEKEVDRIAAALRDDATVGGRKNIAIGGRWLKRGLALTVIVGGLVAASAFVWPDRQRTDQLVNCVKYGCDLNYATYRSRAMGLEFVYPQRHLMLDTTKERLRQLPLLNHKGEIEVTIQRSAMPAHGNAIDGSAAEQKRLTEAGNSIHYVGPQVDAEKKSFYVIAGATKDAKIFYIRRWYASGDVVSIEYVYPPELKPLYDKIITDMTMRSMKISQPH